MTKRIAAFFFLIYCICSPSFAIIELDAIMKANDFIGTEPSRIQWSSDSKTVYFFWKSPDEKQAGTFSLNTLTGKLQRLSGDQLQAVPDPAIMWNRDRTKGLRFRNGTVWMESAGAKKPAVPLIENVRGLRLIGWNRDATGFYFLTSDALVAFSLAEPRWRVLFRFGESTKPAQAPKPVDTGATYLSDEEKKLIRNYPAASYSGFDRSMAFGSADTTPDFILEKGERLGSCQVSPDGTQVLVSLYVSVSEPEPRSTDIPLYISRTAYTTIEKTRDKAVAAYFPRQRFYLYSVVEKKRVEVKAVETDAGITSMTFSPQGKLIGWVEGTNQRDAWLRQFNEQGAAIKTIWHLHDDAWLQRTFSRMSYRFIPGRDQLLMTFEADDHIRLAQVDLDGKTKFLSGAYEVDEFDLSEDGRTVTMVTSEGHPGIRNTYLLDLNTGTKKALTVGNGFHRAYPAPDLKQWVSVESDRLTPPELYLYKAGQKKQITVSPSAEFRSLKLKAPEVIRFPASDGISVYARLLRPEKKNGAAVLFVHGAGYLQDAHFGWSEYWREFLFGNLLAERGYTFIDIDYRGSLGYGRNFRTGIYQHMGKRDLQDLLDGVALLVEKEGIDPRRVGVFGGSYGGFLTLMGLFQSPDTFACGAALRPVTDWAHYSSYYTNPILGGKPQDVPEHYRRSSPIYFAENLKKPLLLLHGMADDNVHFQDSVRLAERLIELKKTDWWLVGFPSERHTFAHADSWLDEYRRILELFEARLR